MGKIAKRLGITALILVIGLAVMSVDYSTMFQQRHEATAKSQTMVEANVELIKELKATRTMLLDQMKLNRAAHSGLQMALEDIETLRGECEKSNIEVPRLKIDTLLKRETNKNKST